MKAVNDRDLTRGPREDTVATLRALARAASIEVTPARIGAGPSLCEALPSGTSVYVPFLPRAPFGDTVTACRELLASGMKPIPHITPRAARSRAEMHEWLSALRESGVDALLLIAGDRRRAAGPYASTIDVLESGLLLDYGLRQVGIAGHPEGHPSVPQTDLDRALAVKADYAASTGTDMWIVTQFVFSSAPTLAWLQRIRETAPSLPVRIGLPGPARLRTLIAYAASCGVSASARVLKQRPDAARLLGRWTPDGLLRDLAQYRDQAPEPLFDGVHLFPFGGVGRSADWLTRLRADSADARRHEAAGTPLT